MICIIKVTMVTMCRKAHKNLKMELEKDSEIIDKFGGTTAVACLCDVSPQAVSKWKRYGVPKYRLKYLKLLKPELFEHNNKAVNE